jgi:hypothetical protein
LIQIGIRERVFGNVTMRWLDQTRELGPTPRGSQSCRELECGLTANFDQ